MPRPPHAPLQPPASVSKPYEGAAADVFTCGVLMYRLLVRFSYLHTCFGICTGILHSKPWRWHLLARCP